MQQHWKYVVAQYILVKNGSCCDVMEMVGDVHMSVNHHVTICVQSNLIQLLHHTVSFHFTFCDFSPNLWPIEWDLDTHAFFGGGTIYLETILSTCHSLCNLILVIFVSLICLGTWSVRLDCSFVWICVFTCNVLVFISKLWDVQISQCANRVEMSLFKHIFSGICKFL